MLVGKIEREKSPRAGNALQTTVLPCTNVRLQVLHADGMQVCKKDVGRVGLDIDQVQKYLEEMAKRTMENTYRAGRTEANVADVLQGFQQMVRDVCTWWGFFHCN